MLGNHGRSVATVVFTPFAKLLARIGITPNMVTYGSAVIVAGLSFGLLARGYLGLGGILLGVVLFAEFDWNTVPGMGARVRDWYAEQFPDDPLGGMIASDVTFAQTVESLHGGDVYDRLGVGESVVRERVFAELSARIGCGYDDIYDAWLNGDGLDPRLVSDPDPEPERRFGIDDVEMRRSATWPGGPHVLSAELPDGRILGHVIP